MRTAALVIGGALAVATVAFVWHRMHASSQGRDVAGSRARALMDWGFRRAAAGNSLYSCLYRKADDDKRHAGIALGAGVIVGVAAIASGAGFGVALKAAGTGTALANKIQGEVAGCDAEAADAKGEWQWIIDEAARLGVPLDISEEDLAWEIIEAEGGVSQALKNNQDIRKAEYAACVKAGHGGGPWPDGVNLDPSKTVEEVCASPRGEDKWYGCGRDWLKSSRGHAPNHCGWATPAYYRGETDELAQTDPRLQPTDDDAALAASIAAQAEADRAYNQSLVATSDHRGAFSGQSVASSGKRQTSTNRTTSRATKG